ncbi:MAG: hypothetical protein JW795_06200 [Chitinivibrionales bacterium]|nr:hypothetical protein [Chitinivibrionales bacterium]
MIPISGFCTNSSHVQSLRTVLSLLISLVLLQTTLINAKYFEGIDTTDANGNGLNKSFRVKKDTVFADKMYFYETPRSIHPGTWYGFNYHFDDIRRAPGSSTTSFVKKFHPESIINRSFVVKRADSTYAKIMIVKKISNSRYIFRFGYNDGAEQTLLAPDDYNRDSIYKPENFHIWVSDYTHYRTFACEFEWEPPLPNNHQLVGYAIYKLNSNANPDTLKNADLSGWEFETFTRNIKSPRKSLIPKKENYCYWNIISVYVNQKGDTVRSRPLDGWTKIMDWGSSIRHPSPTSSPLRITNATYILHLRIGDGSALQKNGWISLNGRTLSYALGTRRASGLFFAPRQSNPANYK